MGVSRTFALSIPELPGPVDEWVGCAYLVCRMIDTLEDRPGASEAERQLLFDRLIAVLGPPVDVAGARAAAEFFAAGIVDDPCAKLMARGPAVLSLLASFPPEVTTVIRRCAMEMASGLRRTPLPPKSASPRCLFNTMHEVERYCHYAAGVVGVMLTRLFYLHLSRDPESIDRRMLHMSKRFGRGLQLTNIIKDHPADLVDGRCFIPMEAAERFGYATSDLVRPSLPIQVRAWVVRRAAAHLDAALEYCLALPPEPIGIRLFCVQPMMMAILTLERVITHSDPTPDDRPKITRSQVESVIHTSRQVSQDDTQLRSWYRDTRGTLDRALART
ncbi:MAG: squalene/phytoene synthase family protein [Planctomycetes bacterium]|nr:squalene/phytoene synthase family protein [Planctomycetota bacterium]